MECGGDLWNMEERPVEYEGELYLNLDRSNIRCATNTSEPKALGKCGSIVLIVFRYSNIKSYPIRLENQFATRSVHTETQSGPIKVSYRY